MPVYEYRCPRCGVDFELMRRVSEMNQPALCPQCGAEAEKLVSVFASKVGFYVRAPAKPAFREPSKKADDTAPDMGNSQAAGSGGTNKTT